MNDEVDELRVYMEEAEKWLRSLGPIVLDERYLRQIDELEKHPKNQDGANKDWLDRLQRATRESFKSVRRLE